MIKSAMRDTVRIREYFKVAFSSPTGLHNSWKRRHSQSQYESCRLRNVSGVNAAGNGLFSFFQELSVLNVIET
jgi:hypothetical protein